MEEKQYAVLLTETQDVKVMACNPDKDMFDIGREAIGCDWIELVEAEPLAKDGLLMMIDEEGKLKPGTSGVLRVFCLSEGGIIAVLPGGKDIPEHGVEVLDQELLTAVVR